jgi:hypothetical protein
LAEYTARIFAVRWCGKTAGMLVAFQGFAAPHGGKKTAVELKIFALAGIRCFKDKKSPLIIHPP